MAQSSEDTSVRKRLSIPRKDISVVDWWEMQHDPALSFRLLVRADIERNGHRDVAYGQVERVPRPGRPVTGSRPASGADDDQEREASSERSASVSEHLESAEVSERPVFAGIDATGPENATSDESPQIASLMGM